MFSLTKKFFSPEEVHYINYLMRFTPDVYFVSRFKYWWMFVYSSDQFGHPDVIQEAEYQPHTAYTTVPYALWTKHLGGAAYSVMLDECNHDTMIDEEVRKKTKMLGSYVSGFKKKIIPWVPLERVKGELVKVTPEQIYNLDEIHQNTLEFTRRRISLIIPFRFQWRDKENKLHVSPEYTQLVTAWTYMGIQEFWDKQITDSSLFKPAKLFQPADEARPKFYHHDKLTYDE